MSGTVLNAPVVSMAATPSGQGYWLVAADGGIFSFGDASFFGSTGGMHLNAPIVGMAATASGNGYWLVAADGGVFSYGDASFYGSTGGMHLNAVGRGHGGNAFGQRLLARRRRRRRLQLRRRVLPRLDRFHPPQPAGGRHGGDTLGQRLLARRRRRRHLQLRDASFEGSTGSIRLNESIDGMAPGPGGDGYWLVAADGGIFNFGSAAFDGSATGDINPLLVNQLASTGGAQQVLIVDAPSAGSTTATLTAYENDGAGWYQVFGPMPAVDGANGWLPGQSRIEGDDTTPEGMYAIGSTMYGTNADPGTQFPYHQLVCGDWWDEDSASPTYNTFQHVACGTTPPYADESEALWTEGNAYPSMAVIDYNMPPTGATRVGHLPPRRHRVPDRGLCLPAPERSRRRARLAEPRPAPRDRHGARFGHPLVLNEQPISG